MGHGGTLDPLATGVLVVAIGRGTKTLGSFLSGTKTYETVVLFGKSTDTYDVAGRVVADAPYNHITKSLVEEKLAQFRGKIKQVPPIYSALKIDGMKAYEYARTGKELPRELESRDMTVEECELLEWYAAGEHDFKWPRAEALPEDKAAALKLMRVEKKSVNMPQADTDTSTAAAAPSKPAAATSKSANDSTKLSYEELNKLPAAEKAALHTHDVPDLQDHPADAPAVRVRLTSSSGFYVRSFAHDLGLACGSYATMSELSRSRQSSYTIYDPLPEGQVLCLTYEDLEQGEDVWGPKISGTLQKWMADNPVVAQTDRIDDRDRPHRDKKGYRSRTGNGQRYGDGFRGGRGGKRKWSDERPRRNSSSPE